MALVDDVRADKRTRNVLTQTNTKTVGAPPAATGLIGDQLPEEVFTVADFDLVKNQVTLEENNFELLNALNIMGQISNLQSQSGPIPGTYKCEQVTSLSSGTAVNFFTPAKGEVWQVVECGFHVTGGGTAGFFAELKDQSNDVIVPVQDRLNVTEGAIQFDDFPSGNIYHTEEVRFQLKYVNVSGTTNVNAVAAFIRVR
tara:strand:- start:907 stop:1503 length:597 start_codon:yes stop_codon:yes gene_type:complete